MPAIQMGSQQLIRLLERKQIQHQLPDLRIVADGVVQNTRVRRREHAVGAVRQLRHMVDDVVAQALEAQPVGEHVEVQQRVVGGLPVLEGCRR